LPRAGYSFQAPFGKGGWGICRKNKIPLYPLLRLRSAHAFKKGEITACRAMAVTETAPQNVSGRKELLAILYKYKLNFYVQQSQKTLFLDAAPLRNAR